jgi:hypothetical protein
MRSSNVLELKCLSSVKILLRSPVTTSRSSSHVPLFIQDDPPSREYLPRVSFISHNNRAPDCNTPKITPPTDLVNGREDVFV